MSAMFQNLGLGADKVDEVLRLTEGWPIAVQLMLRLATQGRLAAIMAGSRGTDLDLLLDYLSCEYIESLSEAELRVLTACCALPSPILEELGASSGLKRDAVALFVRDCPFVRQADGAVEAHPLLRALMVDRFRGSLSEFADASIVRSERMGDFIRAAEIAIALGHSERAARILSALPADPKEGSTHRLAMVVADLEADTIVSHPTLWLAALDVGRNAATLSQLVDEARRVLYTLPASTPAETRAEVVVQAAWIMINDGKADEALRMLAEHLESADPLLAERIGLITTAMTSMSGRYLAAREAYRKAALSSEHPRLYATMVDFIDATTALRSGDYERGIALLEEAVRVERRHGLTSRFLVSLSNLAFEAWLVDDGDRFGRAVAELRASLLPGMEKVWSFWLSAANGDMTSEPTGYEFRTLRVIGYLFLAASSSGRNRVAFATRAVTEADAYGDVGLKVISRVAAAEYDRPNQQRHHGELKRMATQLDLPAFRDAVERYVAQDSSFGALDPFVRKRLRGKGEGSPDVEIRLATTSVTKSGVPIDLADREFALLAFMAIGGRSTQRDALTEALWPHADRKSAENSLRVTIHRVRRKLGEATIVSIRSGYCLGPAVRVDLPSLERTIRQSTSETQPTSMNRLREAIEQLDSIRVVDPELDWCVTLYHRLNELRRDAILALSSALILSNSSEEAVDRLQQLIQLDPTDEGASERLMRAYCAQGDMVKAEREGKRYEGAALREGDEFGARRMRRVLRQLQGSNEWTGHVAERSAPTTGPSAS
jgi:DNA-binding SARP family transcriptional activator